MQYQSLIEGRDGRLFQLVLLSIVVFSAQVQVATAFSINSPDSCALIGTKNTQGIHFQRQIQRGQELFSTPPASSPLSDDGHDFDNYTSAEKEKMQDVILSLSNESNDDHRRNRLKQILDIELAGPNGGPKRFAVLFEKVLTQVGEQVQREARANYISGRASASGSSNNDSNNIDGNMQEEPPEKSPEELRLWALVDMMVQSKTIMKKHNL